MADVDALPKIQVVVRKRPINAKEKLKSEKDIVT